MKLRPHCHTAIFTIPTFVSIGASASSTQNIAPPLPAGAQANDILIFMASWNDAGSAPTTVPAGYTFIGGISGDQSRIIAYYKRHTGVELAQTFAITNPQGVLGSVMAFRGCVTAGSPIDQSANNSDTTNQTALSCPVITPTYPNTMVVNMVGMVLDATTATEFSGWTNASLASITEASDNTTSGGIGAGLGSAYGIRAATGLISATTLTGVTNVHHVYFTFNLIGVQT